MRAQIRPTETGQFWLIVGNWAFPHFRQLCETKREASKVKREMDRMLASA